tara:strand:- start:312 stop:533 length:222 start_codon:yes stop_codon:yes gene_type:complete
MKTEIIDINEFKEHFDFHLSDIAHTEDYDFCDAVNMKLIRELGERGVVKSFCWNDKDGFTLEMKTNWKDAINY